MGDATLSIFDTCASAFDPSSDLTGLMKCISDEHSKIVDEKHADMASGIDSFYLIYGGALVFFMQTGFAMLCAGSIRAKNAKNVLLWNLLDSCGGGLAFWATGYAFAYGGDDMGDKTFIGNTNFFLRDTSIRLENWFFQFAFACAVSSIVAGAIAERTKMIAYLLYSVFVVGFVYPVVAHSFWSTNGFLSPYGSNPLWGSGAIDLAGSGPVHMTGGVTSLAAALVLGPRIGRFHDENGNPLDKPHEFPPHSVALQFLGTFCLWFGWYGFNPGSVMMISSASLGDVAALVAVNTTLAACAGAVSAMFTSTLLDYYQTGVHTYDLSYTMNGCLTGLVAITSGCASVKPYAGVLIGIGAGWAYLLGSKLLVRFRIDDAVDAIPVHMFGGAWGVLATGLFSHRELLKNAYNKDEHAGWFYDGSDFTLMGTQILAVLFIFGWTFVVTGAFFMVINALGLFRVDPLEEEVGMDISRHKGAAYDLSGANQDVVEKLNSTRHLNVEDTSGSRRGSKKQNEMTAMPMDKPISSAEQDELKA